jgi:hypothetical protein
VPVTYDDSDLARSSSPSLQPAGLRRGEAGESYRSPIPQGAEASRLASCEAPISAADLVDDEAAVSADIVAALWPERCDGLVSVSGYLIGSQTVGRLPLPPEAELQ